MAIKTVWPVEHSCGHEREHDLNDKRPSERAGYARWLATKDCSDCWRACRDKHNSKDKERWLGERRAEEAATIECWERSCAMPALDGSDKAVAWGSQIRHQLVVAAHDHAQSIGVSGDDFGQQVEAPCRRITSASWWIDQRDAAVQDEAELVVDAASNPLGEHGHGEPVLMGQHWLNTDGPFPDDTFVAARLSLSGSGGRTSACRSTPGRSSAGSERTSGRSPWSTPVP